MLNSMKHLYAQYSMKIKSIGLATIAIVSVCALIIGIGRNFYTKTSFNSLTPWKCVGGCGAGGSGGTAADIKWIGTGVTGGLIDAEFMSSITVGENFEYKQLKSRFSWKPTYTTNLGLTIPIVSKIGSLQPQTNYDDKTEATAGMADIMVDFSKNIGMEGEYSLSLNLTLPTGQYDVKRGKADGMLYLPTTLQRGSGVYNASLGISRTIDVEKGLWVVEAFYSHPFAINFDGMNPYVNDKSDQYGDVYSRWDNMTDSQKKRFKYHFKPYGGKRPWRLCASWYYRISILWLTQTAGVCSFLWCKGIRSFGCRMDSRLFGKYLQSQTRP